MLNKYPRWQTGNRPAKNTGTISRITLAFLLLHMVLKNMAARHQARTARSKALKSTWLIPITAECRLSLRVARTCGPKLIANIR